MAKKDGLGRDVTKSLEIMDELLESLKKFAHMPLKEGLASNNVADDDEKLTKLINEASEEAFALINKIKDMKHKIGGLKVSVNSRFAHQVVANFLENNPE
jgi:hypothetical protein